MEKVEDNRRICWFDTNIIYNSFINYITSTITANVHISANVLIKHSSRNVKTVKCTSAPDIEN